VHKGDSEIQGSCATGDNYLTDVTGAPYRQVNSKAVTA